jgi:hypothetical protein
MTQKEIDTNKTYLKSELAALYGFTRNTLITYISNNEALKIELTQIGCNPDEEKIKFRKFFTPAEVKLIVQFI